ncbi:MAG TPA: hypothetical protein VGN42_01490, partial [Pirellulales bacterium]|nr:hypothetical protein [Pirellulales bacterium]
VCLLVWSSSWVFITYLVHIAISGIEAAFPLRFADPDVDLDLVARTKRFVLHTGLAAALVPLNAWLTGQLARCWAPRLRRLWVIAICLLISLGATMGYLVWFHLAGLHRFSPSFADNPSTAPLHLWLTAALVLLLASGAVSYRLVSSAGEAEQSLMLDWRREPRRYYHERRLTMLALSVALGGTLAATLQIGRGQGWRHDWQDALDRLFNWPENFIILAAFWLALLGLCGGWRRSSEPIARGQIGISPKKLGAVWLAAFLTFVSSVPLIAWFSFSLWLLFGYRFEWP